MVCAGHDLQAVEHAPRCAARPWVSTKPTTTSVPRSAPPVALLEHLVRLADAGGGAEVDPQLARDAMRRPPVSPARGSAARQPVVRVLLVEGQVELEHVDRGLAEEAEGPAGRVLVDQRLTRPRSMPRSLATRGACSSA